MGRGRPFIAAGARAVCTVVATIAVFTLAAAPAFAQLDGEEPASYEDSRLQLLSPADGATFRTGDAVPFAFRTPACCYDMDAYYEVVISTRPDVTADGFLVKRWQTASLATDNTGYYSDAPETIRLFLQDKNAQLGQLVTWAGAATNDDFGPATYYQGSDGPPLSVPKPADDTYYWQVIVSDFNGVLHSPVRRLTYRSAPAVPKLSLRRAKGYAVEALREDRPRSRNITSTCDRVGRTKAWCLLDWRQGRKSYMGEYRIAYALDAGEVVWTAKLRNVERI